MDSKTKDKIMLSFLKELEKGNIAKAEDYGISQKDFNEIVNECKERGYIKEAFFSRGGQGNLIRVAFFDQCRLTDSGRKYIKENSSLMKAYKGLKEIKEWFS